MLWLLMFRLRTSARAQIHEGVKSQAWFVVGAHIADIVPPEFKSYLSEPHYHGSYRDGGFELTSPSLSPNHNMTLGPDAPPMLLGLDASPIMLRGTQYELEQLKAYVRAQLPEASMLRCVWQTKMVFDDAGHPVSMPIELDETHTTQDRCNEVHAAAGTPITVIGFFENSLAGSAYSCTEVNVDPSCFYGMHVSINSDVHFDNDPYIGM